MRTDAEKDESEPKAYQTLGLDERARENRSLLFQKLDFHSLSAQHYTTSAADAPR